MQSREEAARWKPEGRSFRQAMYAPLLFLWRKANASWASGLIAAGVSVTVIAAVVLLAWGLARTDGDESGLTAAQAASAGDLLGCYRGVPSLPASRSLLGASVSVGGTAVGDEVSDEILTLLHNVTPIYFGVRGTTGTRIGEPGRLAETTLEIDAGGDVLTLKYVRPGPVAPYGLLFDPALINAWEITDVLSPPAYAQQACTVPTEFDQVMADLGFQGYEPDVLESRSVPVADAQRDIEIDRIEVWREGQSHQVLAPPSGDQLMTEAPDPSIELEAVPLHVAIWYRGVDPFPEAVRPAAYLYYPADTFGLGRDVLIQTEAARVHNGHLGRAGVSFYPEPDLNRLLRDAAGR